CHYCMLLFLYFPSSSFYHALHFFLLFFPTRRSSDLCRPAATSTARTAASALDRVSRYSVRGSEPATSPAPACTEATEPEITAVRMAIAMSISPAKSK